MPVCKSYNDEVCRAVKKLKGGKLSGIDETFVEYLRKGGMYGENF